MTRADLVIEQHVPGHVKAINIICQTGAKDGIWKGSIFYHDNSAETSSHSADTLITLLELIENEVFEDMPEHDPTAA